MSEDLIASARGAGAGISAGAVSGEESSSSGERVPSKRVSDLPVGCGRERGRVRPPGCVKGPFCVRAFPARPAAHPRGLRPPSRPERAQLIAGGAVSQDNRTIAIGIPTITRPTVRVETPLTPMVPGDRAGQRGSVAGDRAVGDRPDTGAPSARPRRVAARRSAPTASPLRDDRLCPARPVLSAPLDVTEGRLRLGARVARSLRLDLLGIEGDIALPRPSSSRRSSAWGLEEEGLDSGVAESPAR